MSELLSASLTVAYVNAKTRSALFSTFITGKLLQTVVDNSSSETEAYEADGPLPL